MSFDSVFKVRRKTNIKSFVFVAKKNVNVIHYIAQAKQRGVALSATIATLSVAPPEGFGHRFPPHGGPVGPGSFVANTPQSAIRIPPRVFERLLGNCKGFDFLMVPPEGFEPPTLCSEGRCSIQLSYGGQADVVILTLAVGSVELLGNGGQALFGEFVGGVKH